MTHKSRSRFLAAMKELITSKPRLKLLVLERRLFSKLHGVLEIADDALSLELAMEMGEPTVGYEKDVFWHHGHHSFSPYYPVVRLMRIADSHADAFDAAQICLQEIAFCLDQFEPKDFQISPQALPSWPQDSPTWPQDGPKMMA